MSTNGIRPSVALAAIATVLIVASPGFTQLSESSTWPINLESEYAVLPDITYLTTSNWEGKLDLYLPSDNTEPKPTVIYIHGGAHVAGSKEQSVLRLIPYLQMGWAAVNVEYRLGPVARAPAAVEDCMCALRWVIEHAGEYNLDADRLVISGHSAGSHLALATAMLPSSTGLDRQCPGAPLKVAAIVNWFGIADVLERLEGPHSKPGTVAWFGSNPDRRELAEFISPIKYVREGLPPTITVHGDQDPRIPHSQAIRLHEGLTRVGVANQLVTIPGGGHGGFSPEEMSRSWRAIREFLAEHVLKESATSRQN